MSFCTDPRVISWWQLFFFLNDEFEGERNFNVDIRRFLIRLLFLNDVAKNEMF